MTAPRGLLGTLTLVVVLCFTAWNALRLRTSIVWHAVLEEFQVKGGTAYLALTGAFWSIAGAVLLYALLSGRAWSGRLLVAAGLVYSGWYWLDRILLQAPRQEWLISLTANALVLGILLRTGIVLSRERHG